MIMSAVMFSLRNESDEGSEKKKFQNQLSGEWHCLLRWMEM